MNENMPRTPFSTPLSGSARETEIRIRSIMSGPKKRQYRLLPGGGDGHTRRPGFLRVGLRAPGHLRGTAVGPGGAKNRDAPIYRADQ